MPCFNHVVSRYASDWEGFIVNLPVPTAVELETTEMPLELEAIEPGLPKIEAPLESPVHPRRPTRVANAYPKGVDGSGLGIRLSSGNTPRYPGYQNTATSASMHPIVITNPTQTDRDMDWRGVGNHHCVLNGKNSFEGMEDNQREVDDNGTLEQSWTHVRDSTQSLHPAPLFARKPFPIHAAHQKERGHPHETSSTMEHKRENKNFLPDTPLPEDLSDSDLDQYSSTSINSIIHPALRGQISLSNSARTPQRSTS